MIDACMTGEYMTHRSLHELEIYEVNKSMGVKFADIDSGFIIEKFRTVARITEAQMKYVYPVGYGTNKQFPNQKKWVDVNASLSKATSVGRYGDSELSLYNANKYAHGATCIS